MCQISNLYAAIFLYIFSQSFSQKVPLPKVAANNRLNSGRSSASSAKQLYMSKSRYMPGKKKIHNKFRREDSESQNMWGFFMCVLLYNS